MKIKKFMALLTAATLVLSPTSALAQTTLDGVSVQTDATINYIDISKVIDIDAQTSAGMAFTLDPQNLGKVQGVGNWNPTDGGTIIPQAVTTVTNKSAFPVKTTVNFTVDDTASTKTILVEANVDVNDGTDKKMHLTVTPANAKTSIAEEGISDTNAPVYATTGGAIAKFSEQDLTDNGVTSTDMLSSTDAANAKFGQYVCIDDSASPKMYNQVEVPVIPSAINATTPTTVLQYNAATGGLASTINAVTITNTPGSLAYIMDKAKYYVSTSNGKYELVYEDKDTNTNYETASFIIGGEINKNANWSEYTSGGSKITLTANYTFTPMTDNEASKITKINGTYNSIAAEPAVPEGTAPTYNGTTKTVNVKLSSTSFDVPYDLGTGSNAVTVTGITLISGGQTYTLNNYTVEQGKITFTKATDTNIAYCINHAGTYTLKITTSDSITNNVSFVVAS